MLIPLIWFFADILYVVILTTGSMEEDASDLNVDIEYVADAMLDPSDPLYSDWIKVNSSR